MYATPMWSDSLIVSQNACGCNWQWAKRTLGLRGDLDALSGKTYFSPRVVLPYLLVKKQARFPKK